MTRIIAGSAGGRQLLTPRGRATRPTSERVREALFGRLEHLDALAGARVLDLYAGSGALGLEAASRGAASVLLVDSDRPAAKAIARNIKQLRLPRVEVRAEPVEKTLLTMPPHRMDIVLADPPYDIPEELLTRVLAHLVAGHWLAQDALVVVERASRSPEPVWPKDCELIGPRRYGDTTCWFAEYVPEGDTA